MAQTRFNLADVTLVGRVGSVTLRGGENKILSLSVATDHMTGNRENRSWVTDWHDVTVFTNAEEVANRIVKGDVVTVKGQLRYNTKDNVKYSTIVADIIIPASNYKAGNAEQSDKEDWEE